MIKNKKFIHQLLWLLAGILPWGFGGFLVHTAQSMAVGTLAYWGMGLLVPFLFFLFQRKGYGSEWGALRAAVHLPLWISFIILQMVIFWSYLPMADKAFKESPIPISIAFFVVLTLFTVAAIVLDYVLPSLYEKLSEKGACRKVWLGAAYFSGLIPGFAILSFLGLYYANGMRLDPFTASFFLLEVFSFVFYGKIILGMMTFGIYLFLALSGTKGRRHHGVCFQRDILVDAPLHPDGNLPPSSAGKLAGLYGPVLPSHDPLCFRPLADGDRDLGREKGHGVDI